MLMECKNADIKLLLSCFGSWAVPITKIGRSPVILFISLMELASEWITLVSKKEKHSELEIQHPKGLNAKQAWQKQDERQKLNLLEN